MRRVEVVLQFDVDDDELAAHIHHAQQRGGPYTRTVADWNARDVFAAVDHDIIDLETADLVSAREV